MPEKPFSLQAAELISLVSRSTADLQRLPWVLDAVAENVLRQCGEESEWLATADEIRNFFGHYFREALKTSDQSLFSSAQPAFVYLIAVRRLAVFHFRADRFREAAEYFEELLRLSPDDETGARHFLPNAYTALGCYEDAKRVLERYNDILTIGRYNQALFDFASRRKGDFELHATAALAANPWAAKYLTGERKLPKAAIKDEDYEEGSAKQARWYLWGPGRLWPQLPGALEALKNTTAGKAIRPRRKSRDSITLAAVEDLEEFCQDLLGNDLRQRATLLGLVCHWAERIYKPEPWGVYAERPVFVHLSDIKEPIVAHFSGGLGTILGCNVYCSESDYSAVIDELGDSRDRSLSPESREVRRSVFVWAAQSLTISRERRLEVPRDDRTEIERATGKSNSDFIIYPSSKRRGFEPGNCSNQELLYGLIGLLGLLNKMAIPFDERMGGQVISFEKTSPLTAALREALAASTRFASDHGSAPSELDSIKRKLEKEMGLARPTGCVWQLGVAGHIGGIAGKGGKRAELAAGCLVVEAVRGLVIGMDVFAGSSSPSRALARAMLKAVRETKQRPRSIEIHESFVSPELMMFFSTLSLPVSLCREPAFFLEAATHLLHAQFGQLGELQ